jgi:hypothetical protein
VPLCSSPSPACISLQAFSLISDVPNSAPLKRNRMFIALGLVVAMVSTQVMISLMHHD